MFDSLIQAIKDSVAIKDIDGKTYVHNGKVSFYPTRSLDTIRVKSLESVTKYCIELAESDNALVSAIVVDFNQVTAVTAAEEITGKRNELILATAPDFPFRYGDWMSREKFQIALMSQFVESHEREKLIQLIGQMSATTLVQNHDDGFTQSVEVKRGVTTKLGMNEVKPIVRLKPYRTFLEVEQPESEFLFRFKEGSNKEIECCLQEADGGMWKILARASIGNWLSARLTSLEIPILT